MKGLAKAVSIMVFVVGLGCGAGHWSPAQAQSCNFSVTPVAFGSVDVTANAAVDTTATLSVTCSGLALLVVRVCVNFGAGTGGATNAANRFMASGANQLRYSLYSDAARSQIWGSNHWAGAGAGGVGPGL